MILMTTMNLASLLDGSVATWKATTSVTEFSQKTFVNSKFPRMEFLRNENLNQVVDILKFQRLDRFVKLSGNIYPDLVKVFLTNMWIDDGLIYSQVKGVDMAITDEVWLSVVGLRDAGTIVSRANMTDLGGFDKDSSLRLV